MSLTVGDAHCGMVPLRVLLKKYTIHSLLYGGKVQRADGDRSSDNAAVEKLSISCLFRPEIVYATRDMASGDRESMATICLSTVWGVMVIKTLLVADNIRERHGRKAVVRWLVESRRSCPSDSSNAPPVSLHRTGHDQASRFRYDSACTYLRFSCTCIGINIFHGFGFHNAMTWNRARSS